MSVESPFIDIELSSSVLVPELDGATEVGEAPQMTPRLASHAAALEMTLLSPSGEPDAGPKKDA
jgi:hypothetical protein